MADESYSLRFNEDLHRIREARGVTLEALHEETKIPHELLRQFEENGLYDHPMFNRVYLRSLVRAYAEHVEIDQDEALDALDEAMSGQYDGRLAAVHLGEGEVPAPADEDTPPPEAAEAEEKPPAAPSVVSRDEADAPVAAVPPRKPTPKKPEPEKPTPQKEAKPPPTGRRERRTLQDREAAAPASTEWADQSPPPPLKKRDPVVVKDRGSLFQWLFIGLGVVVLAGAIWGLIALVGGSGDEDDARRLAAADTAQAVDTTATPPPPSRPAVVVGDTLDIVIIASGGPVQGIRITRDQDLRRPYWIEEGEAKEFPALNRAVIENEAQLGKIRLVLEGYEYPTDQRDDQGRIVITREAAEAFADTLSGEPLDLPAELETIRKGAIASQ